jgi:hypothetical protein
MNEEGYIKFQPNWVREELSGGIKAFKMLNLWRRRLYEHQLIGAYPDGIGYGNISVRLVDNEFMISGTATGNIPKLSNEHYTRVTEYDLQNNSLTCCGPILASSESLTHATVYDCMSSIKGVVHIHNKRLWEKLIYKVPTTSLKVKYGTPEMALEIKRLLLSGNMRYTRIIVMAGHEDGLISIGKDLNEAAISFLELLS